MITSTIKVSLRDRKAARIRLGLVDILRERLKTTPYHAVRIEDLCEEAMISKVTFFKYFPEKGALLIFSNACWMMEFQVETRKRGLIGIAAIAYMFESVGEAYNASPHFVKAFYSLISESSTFPHGVELSLAEKLELYPDENPDSYETKSTGNVIAANVKHAFENGEIHTTLTEFEILALVGTLFNGTGILGLRLDPEKPGDLFKTTIGILFKCLGYTGHS